MLCTPQFLKIGAAARTFETPFENPKEHSRNRNSHDQTDHEILQRCDMGIPQTDEHSHQHYHDHREIRHAPMEALEVFTNRHDAPVPLPILSTSCCSTESAFGRHQWILQADAGESTGAGGRRQPFKGLARRQDLN